MTDLSVIIVSYNTRDLTLRCISSVLEHPAAGSVEIVVVDNASDDDSAAAIRRRFPEVYVVGLTENLGFAVGCNAGVLASTGDLVVLLNPDTVMRPGCLDALVETARRRPQAGLVGGRTFTETGALDPHSCWGLPSLWSLFCFASGLSTIFASHARFDPESLGRWQRDDEREVGVVTGCLLLCSRSVWDELGGMDTCYFVYGEDVDFSFRARRAGYRPVITPRAKLTHIRGAASSTSAGKWSMILRGKVTFMRRNWSPRRARFGVVLLAAGAALRALAIRMHVPVEGPWMDNWQRRNDWLDGWEAHLPPTHVVAEALASAGQRPRNET